jgi:hypothetical protein
VVTPSPDVENGWRTAAARRLQRLAGALAPVATEGPGAGPGAGPEAVPPAENGFDLDHDVDPVGRSALAQTVREEPGETAEHLARRRLATVIEELYPTVAARVLALADAGSGPGADIDEWVVVSRLLYDAHMHRVGGPTVEARQRALLATLGRALEAQARSSARLAGYTDEDLDRPSTIDGDPPGMLVWEHYLCGPARLARSALHGEAVGDWLGALGELWASTDALHDLVAPMAPASSTNATSTDASSTSTSSSDASAGAPADDDPLLAALDRVKVALVRVEELSLW